MTQTERYDLGREAARRLWGERRAERVEEALGGLNPAFRDLVIESMSIYNRPGADRKTRCLCTMAALTVLGRAEELRLHVASALNNGATEEEIEEVLMQMALYGGVPAAIEAFVVAKKVFAERASRGK